MSIATDLTRISGAKSALATAITAKGVTVPAATLIDGYAALVDAIQTGGGGFTPPTAQFTLTEEMTVTSAVNAAAFSVKYARCMIVMKITGTNVQINGTSTPRTIIIHVQGAGVYDGSYQCSYRSGGPYAPNNCAFSQNNWYSYASNNFVSISSSNILSISIGGNLYIAAGNTIEFMEIPYNWSTMTFDLTERA